MWRARWQRWNEGGVSVNGEKPKFDTSLIVELICCLLGGCALCSAILPALGQEVGMLECLLFIAVDLSLIFLLTRRWWIFPALIAILALGGMGISALLQMKEAVLEYIDGFIEWYNAAYPYTLPYSENGSRFLVHLAFSFPVTLILYLYFRRFPFLPAWAVVSAGVLVWMYLAKSPYFLGAAALMLIVFLVLLARTNAGSIHRKLGGKGKLPSAAMQLTALALAPLAVLFSVAIGPKTDGAWKSKGLVNFIQDVQDVFSFYGDGSYGSGGFDLGYSGLAPNGFALGGDVEPDNRTILRVKTATPILLAGAVYDTYDGRGWYDSAALGRFRFTSLLWRGKRREAFSVDKPSARKTAGLYGKVSRVVSMEVSMTVRHRSLFSNGKVERVELDFSDDSDVYFNSQGELYLTEVPALAQKYTLRTRVYARDREFFNDYMGQLIRLSAYTKDAEYGEIERVCTAVPETVEPFVYELAEEITRYCPTDFDKALAIEAWLSENCSYTRNPGTPEEGRDFVSAFLEEREGYCTYYATAMTILARIAGLPARYVTGYGLKQEGARTTESFVATNATAHAWTQIYFYGVGWVDFDPSQWEFYAPVERDEPVVTETKPEKTPEIPDLRMPDLPQPNDLREPVKSGSTASSAPKKTGTWTVVLIILCCDLGALLIFLLVRFVLLFFRSESFYRRVTRRYPDLRDRADVCYRRILKQLVFLGLEMEPADTIRSFCARVDGALSPEKPHETMAEVCEPVLLSRFAMRKPREGDIRRMCDFCLWLEGELRRAMGVRRYIVRRMILGK
jgi:transglutaminase-like putative cysteine protease